MHAIPRLAALLPNVVALLLAGCSEKRAAAPDMPKPVTPATQPPCTESPRRPASSPDDTTAAPQSIDSASSPQAKADPNAIERRYLAAPNDPAARIAAIRELANATPIAALTTLNRLFPTERREDVKGEMLAAIGDLDHTKERDQQLALCTKALAADQPMRIRYLAIHAMAELRDLRTRNFLLPLQNDPDPEIRAAIAQALRDLAP